ncbi:MAG: UDP binding domain-containing protein [Pseudomonadota bacterium]|nr:UDP binding domain-containing protein [Pseudomonadota bacterium]
MSLKIGFAGLSHLGLCSLAGAVRHGFEVVGVHQDGAALQRYRASGELWISEPKLKDILSKNSAKIIFDKNLSALSDCDIIYISSDVPTDSRGNSDLGGISRLLEEVVKSVSPASIIVLLSQVPPGFARAQMANFKCLYYQVETLIFGEAIDRASFPERLIIGCENKENELNEIFLNYLAAYKCPIIQMDFESAELAKISINLLLTAQVTVSNVLSEVSEKVGADWLDIVPALRLDRRIGEHAYILPGFGITGGNLERDLRSIVNIGQRLKIDVSHVESMIVQSDRRRNWAFDMVSSIVESCTYEAVKVGVLGVAYKTGTNSVKNSVGFELIRKLHSIGIEVSWHDPATFNLDIEPIVEHRSKSVADCVANADVLIICTPWDEYMNLDWVQVACEMRGDVVIDPFRLVNNSQKSVTHLNWVSMGLSSSVELRD